MGIYLSDEDLLPFRDSVYRQDPYPFYDVVRPMGDAYRNQDGLYVFTRHDHISQLLRDRTLSALELDYGPAELQHHAMIGQDPPDHTRLRRATNEWFMPETVTRWSEWVEKRIEELFAKAEPSGEIEAVYGLAFPLTHGLMCHILDIEWQGETTVRDMTFAFGMSLGPGADEDDFRATTEASNWFASYISNLIDKKRIKSGTGMLDSLIQKMDEGELTETEVIATTFLFFAVGHLDITYLLVNGLKLFAENHAVLEAFRDKPEIRANIINEILRFDTPEQFVARRTTVPITIGSSTIEAGEDLFLMVGAANKDPEIFENPHTFNIYRENMGRHLAFGGGMHGCVGQIMARATANIVFSYVASNYPDISVNGDVIEGHTEFMRTFHSVPLKLW